VSEELARVDSKWRGHHVLTVRCECGRAAIYIDRKGRAQAREDHPLCRRCYRAHRDREHARKLKRVGPFLPLAVLLTTVVASGQVPRAALRYQRALIGNARVSWGLDAPVAVFAAQVHQESGWNPEARSAFASGLAQFTPATADWISDAYVALVERQPLNPSWALRALVIYDRHLWLRVDAAAPCDRVAFALSAYNGGLGWVGRDARLAAAQGKSPLRWWGHVETASARAGWAFRENRDYVRRILLVLQARYRSWGPGVSCPP
jgi:hypothetical protein